MFTKENEMGDMIKVKVVKMSSTGWGYQHMIGKTIDVIQSANNSEYYYSDGAGDDWDEGYILKADCIVVTAEALQDRLQQAKAAVEEIEKQIAKGAEKEAKRPFTREEYERVVAEYRGCEGRSAFKEDTYNFTFEINNTHGGLVANAWINSKTCAPFGVFFSDRDDAETAIAKVGAENLKRAWQYEMSIGLKE